jgi:hypothetical protein
VAASVVAALVLPGVVNIGLLPGTAKFLDIPLAWGALASAALHGSMRSLNPPGARIARWLVALVFVIGVSFAFNPSEPLRPVVYAMLLGQPFAIVAAVLMNAPSQRAWRGLAGLLLGLAILQIPIALYQAATVGLGDPVQGTLYGKGAGAHLLGGLGILVALWLLAGGAPGRRGAHVIVWSAGLLALPLLADAKAALFAATPAVILLLIHRRQRPITWLVGAALFLSVAVFPATATALAFIDRAAQGDWGKRAAGEMVLHALGESAGTVAFGIGPASTVSRTSFMTTDLLLTERSPLRALNLQPSVFARAAETEAIRVSGGQTSFDSAQSSALGVLGDLGVAGLVVFLALVGAVTRLVLASRAPESWAVCGMWIMYLILGAVFEWWEEPPFTVPLALITALTVRERASEDPGWRGSEGTRARVQVGRPL